MRRIITVFVLTIILQLLIGFDINKNKVFGQGCVIYDCSYTDPDTGILVETWCDGCGGNWDYCPPNYHLGDDGETCRENGTGEEET